MDIIMPKDYQDRFWDMIVENLDNLGKKVDNNTDLTNQALRGIEVTNQKVDRINGSVADLQKWRDNQMNRRRPLNISDATVKLVLILIIMIVAIIWAISGRNPSELIPTI